MKEGISGFEVSGTWEEIVEHGERITEALLDAGVSRDALAEWQSWRPKATEEFDEEMNEKTAAQASVDEGAGERAGQSPGDDLRTAGEKAAEGIDEARANDRQASVAKGRDSVGHAARAADSVGRKALRAVENVVYERVMMQIAPQYFDDELLSANLQRGGGDDEFAFEVDVNDDDLKDDVSASLASDEADERWHGATEPATEIAEVVEGVDAPETPRGPTSPQGPVDSVGAGSRSDSGGDGRRAS